MSSASAGEPTGKADAAPDAGGPNAGRWRRRLLIAGGALFGGAVVLIGGAYVFVNSDSGTQWLVARGLRAYDGGVAGSIAYSAAEGNFDEGLTLRDLELHDHDGRLLIAAERVGLKISPWRALRGKVELRDFEVEDSTVILPAEGEPGFADLRGEPRPEDEKEKDEDDGEPSSSVFDVSMHLARLELRRRHVPGEVLADTELLMDLRRFDVDAHLEGGEAKLKVGIALSLPGFRGLEVEALDLDLSYKAPVARIERLDVKTSWGDVFVAGLELDPEHGWAQVDEGVVNVEASMLRSELGLELMGASKIQAEGRLDLAGSDFHLDADLGPAGSAHLDFKSTPFPKLGVDAKVDAALDLEALAPGRGLGPAQLGLELSASPPTSGPWGAALGLRCRGCEGAAAASEQGVLRVSLTSAPAEAAATDPRWAGEVQGEFAGAKLRGQLQPVAAPRPDAPERTEIEVELSLRGEELARLNAALQRLGLAARAGTGKETGPQAGSELVAPWAGAGALALRCRVSMTGDKPAIEPASKGEGEADAEADTGSSFAPRLRCSHELKRGAVLAQLQPHAPELVEGGGLPLGEVWARVLSELDAVPPVEAAGQGEATP